MECGKCENNMSFETSGGVSCYRCWCCGNRIYPSYPARVGAGGYKGVVLNRRDKGGDEDDRERHSDSD